MRVFVTGATGFVGSKFIASASRAGWLIYALRRASNQSEAQICDNVQWCVGELDDDWANQLSKCDAFVHFAAAGVLEGNDDWEHCFRVNVHQTLSILRQSIQCGVKRFLICGSCFEYGAAGLDHEFIPVTSSLKPTSAYSSSKAAASIAALGLANEFNLQLLIVRPFHLYGIGESQSRFWPQLVQAAINGHDFPMTKGEQVRDFMEIGQAVDILIEMVGKLSDILPGGCIKNLGTGNPRTLREFAESEWVRLGGAGTILLGDLDYRKNEIMRYVPRLD
jgi:nucleoside-diphosphate-sugar epimerase